MKESFFTHWAQALGAVLFPGVCRHCGAAFSKGRSNVLCEPCFDSVQPYQDPVCGHCGISLLAGAFEASLTPRCSDCGEVPYHLDQVRAWGPYDGSLRILHHSFKFEGMEGLKAEIAEKLHASIPNVFWKSVEALVPVPQIPEKERERGYNPAHLMAFELSRLTSIFLRPLLSKIRKTPAQMSLPRNERLKNPIGAYAVRTVEMFPRRLVLVDDVFTTGATLEECAKVLKKAGAEWVGAVVLGRTPRQS